MRLNVESRLNRRLLQSFSEVIQIFFKKCPSPQHPIFYLECNMDKVLNWSQHMGIIITDMIFTFKMPVKTAADNILKYFLFYFSKKIRLGIS